MALEDSVVSIPLATGLNQKIDDKNLNPGQLKALENAVFNKAQRIDKRNGTDLIGSEDINGVDVGPFLGVATFENELLAYNGSSVYSYIDSLNQWSEKGAAVFVSCQTDGIIRNTEGQLTPDILIHNGIIVSAWVDTNDEIRCTIKDETTDTSILSNELVASVTTPGTDTKILKLVSFKDYIYITWRDTAGNNIYSRRIDTLNPIVIESAVTVVADNDVQSYHFLNMSDIKLSLAYVRTGFTGVHLAQFDEDMVALSISTDVATTYAVYTLTQVLTDNLNIVLALFETTSEEIQAIRFSNGYDIIDSLTTLEATASVEEGQALTGAFNNARLTFFCSIMNEVQDDPYNYVTVVSCDEDLTNITLGSDILGCQVYSEAFVIGNSIFFVASHTVGGGLQNSYYLIRSDGYIAARQQYGSSGIGVPYFDFMPSSVTISNNTAVYGAQVVAKFQSLEGGALNVRDTRLGINQNTISFANNNIFKGEEIAESLYLPGGILQLYDGESIVESGFLMFPAGLFPSASQPGGLMTAGVHQLLATYEWTDNKGQVHISGTSTIATFTSLGSDFTNLDVNCLHFTQKENVVIAVYMTTAGGSLYYRATSVDVPTYNDKTVSSVTVKVDISDASLQTNALIYTTGGVFQNIAPPSCEYVEVFKGRLFLAGMENGSEYYYSKENKEGVPLEFCSEFSDIIESVGGPISALSTLDDKLFLWKKNRPYFIYGDGPNDLGSGLFARPQGINIDVGCDEHHSIVRFPNGLLFKSEKGIYSIDSGFGVQYIGHQVEDFNQTEITSAVLKAEDNEIRFTTRNNVSLIYNYFFGQWSVFKNYEANSAIVWLEKYMLLRTDGKVYEENELYQDNGTPIKMLIETGWISLAGIQGFQRVRRFGILGTYKSNHILQITVSYDYKDSAQDVYHVNTEETMNVLSWGEKTQWGETDTQWGGDDISYHFRFHLSQQKCKAIKFKIEDIPQGANGESLNLTNIALQVAGKKGIGRTRVSKSLGAS